MYDMYPFHHQNILLRPHFPNCFILFFFSLKWLKELCNAISCGSPLVSRIGHCRKNLVANCFRNFGKKIKRTVRKCIEKIANIAKITNSIRIANCSKTFLTDFCRNFSKNFFNRNCLQKLKKVCKNLKSNKKFHCNKKNTQITIARISRITK